jgi:DNA polymerase
VQWLAGDENALNVFREGRDPYKVMGSIIFEVPYEAVTKDIRRVGKQAILGLGYQMGASKFYSTCINSGCEVSVELAEKTVAAYRKHHGILRNFWYRMEQGALAAIEQKSVIRVNKISFDVKDDFLRMRLPSGRHLHYFKPEKDDEGKVSFLEVNGYTRPGVGC